MENVWIDYSQLAMLVLGFGLIIQSFSVLFGFCGLHCFLRSFQQHPGWCAFLLLTGLLLVILSYMLQGILPERILQAFLLAVVMSIGLSGLVFRKPEKFLLSGKTTKTGSQQYQVAKLDLADDDNANIVTLKPHLNKSNNDQKKLATLVLIHGGGNDRLYGFWYLVEALLDRGHPVVTGHMPGHGRKGCDVFSVEAVRKRIQSMVTLAKQSHPTRPVVLLGQSMGGALALDGVSRGLSVDAVVTVSTLYRLDLGAHILSELWAFTRPAIFRALQYGNPYEVLPAAGWFKRRVFPVRVTNGASYIQEFRNCLDQINLLRVLQIKKIACPVRLIHGVKDGVVPVTQARMLGEAIGSMAQIVTYEKCTHLDPLFDSKVLDDLLEWLDKPAGFRTRRS